MIGTTLGHFRIVAKLGASRSGVVYRAEDEALRRPVALRVLSPALASDPEHKERFLQAARAAARVTHPHVAAVHEVGESEGLAWVAMELVEGPSLRSRLTGRPLPLLETLRIGEQVAEGLAAAHEQNLGHGDLKPEKVVLGPGWQVKVLDLGLGDNEGGEEGSPAYDTRTDVYRLGAMLYEMATGRPPASADAGTRGADASSAAATIPPSTLNPETPAELDRIIGACLEADPEDRYQHASQLSVDLGKLRRWTETAPVVVPSRAAEVGTEAKRHPARCWLWIAASLALAAALGLAGWQWAWPRLKPAPPFRKGDRILVADFVNETDDVEMGVALRDVFEEAVNLPNENFGLSAVQRDTMTEVSALDGSGAEVRCLRGECGGYATGKVAPLGSGYSLEIALYRAGVAKPVFAHTEQAADGKVGDALVAALGAIRHFLLRQAVIDTPIPEGCWVWSGDVNGVKAEQALYRAGTRGYDKPAEQLALAERALELDPTNPWNYRMKGWVYWKLGRRREGLPLMKEAWQRMSAAVDAHPGCRDFELQLEIAYLERSWSYDTQLERLNRAVQLYPNNPSHWDYLGNAIYRVMGDPAAAIAPYRKAYELSPAYFPWYCTYLLAAGKSDEVDPLIEDFRRRSGTEMGPKEQTIAEAQIDQAYVRGDDYRAILTMVDRFVAEGRLPGEPRGLRADYLALTGRLVDAEKWAREAAKGGATTAMMSGGAAQGGGYWLLDWLEKRRTGKVRALTTDEADSYLDNSLWLARLAAASVDLGTTHSLAESLRTAEEEHKDVRIQRVLDVWQYGHGCLALVEGKATEAVNLLEPLAREYGPGSNLPPQHVLGRAYEATGRWADAARAYEAALQKRPFWQMGAPLGPVFVLDQHRLAGIYDRLGNAERARYWYGRFLNDWRNADPGTPEVEDAKRRLAALGGPLPQGG